MKGIKKNEPMSEKPPYHSEAKPLPRRGFFSWEFHFILLHFILILKREAGR